MVLCCYRGSLDIKIKSNVVIIGPRTSLIWLNNQYSNQCYCPTCRPYKKSSSTNDIAIAPWSCSIYPAWTTTRQCVYLPNLRVMWRKELCLNGLKSRLGLRLNVLTYIWVRFRRSLVKLTDALTFLLLAGVFFVFLDGPASGRALTSAGRVKEQAWMYKRHLLCHAE